MPNLFIQSLVKNSVVLAFDLLLVTFKLNNSQNILFSKAHNFDECLLASFKHQKNDETKHDQRDRRTLWHFEQRKRKVKVFCQSQKKWYQKSSSIMIDCALQNGYINRSKWNNKLLEN